MAASRGPTVSVIVPTLNEANAITQTISTILRVPGVTEVCVVDGGSSDDTRDLARAAGARVISAPRGRGSQLAAGARACSGDVVWFLHADTLPPQEGVAAIVEALAQPQVIGGHFRPRFEGGEWAPRFLTWLYPHLSLLGLKYGDAGLFVRHTAYDAVGGFANYPIFEDLDLLRRLRRKGTMIQLSAEVLTSSRRFAGRSFAWTFAVWAGLQVLYWLGVSPHRLGRWYPALRSPGRRRARSAQ